MSDAPPCRHRLAGRRLAAANARFEVFFDHVEGPDGAVPNFLMVRPTVLHADLVSGVCVLPEVDGRVGLMRIRRPHFVEAIWVAPSGFVEPDESTEASALRELREETGLTCDPKDLRPLGLLLLDPAVLEARVALFVAARARPAARDASDAGELGVGALTFFAPDALEELAATSPDMDGGTVAACLRYLAAHRR
ncbi:NUDIX domain-containing protein [Azospirillum sp.]|uniref:NUDIX domain-containing protein n=1 Tax=Azospirillum sp. TaxID=34012 RepID=UPI003D708AE5